MKTSGFFGLNEPVRTLVILAFTYQTVCDRRCVQNYVPPAPSACETTAPGGRCVGGSSSGISPCPSGMAYDTSFSCNNLNLTCCRPIPPPPPPPPPKFDINGYVWIDYDYQGDKDSNEPYYTGNVTLSLSGDGSGTTNAAAGAPGPYTFFDYNIGRYTVSITVPPGYRATTSTSRSFNLSYDRYNENFGIAPVYSISGSIFRDDSKDFLKNNGEGRGPLGVNFSINNNNFSADANGNFTINNLDAGTYTIQYHSPRPDSSYEYYHPKNGPPPTFLVRVGPNCGYDPNHNQAIPTPSAAASAICTNGNISNLNFIMTNSHQWLQGVGLNLRFSSGFTNRIPASPVYPAYTSIVDNFP